MFDGKNPYDVSKIEFEYLLPHSKHRADIYVEGPDLKVDAKSWKPKSISSNLVKDGKLTTQLKNYFKNKPFEHSYDYKRFHKAFSDRKVADDLYNHITDNKKNPLKFEEVFGAENVDEFLKDVVPDINNSDLYGFIKVR